VEKGSLVPFERIEFQYAHVRRVLLVCAAVNLAFIPVDLLYPSGRTAVAWRLGWTVVLLVGASLQLPGRPRAAFLGLHASGLSSGIAGGMIVLLTGGSLGPRSGFLLALGPTVLLLVPDQPYNALLAGCTSLAFAAWMMLHEGRPLAFVGEWFLLAAAFAVLAIYGARWFRRVWIGQLRAERERAFALERLAMSERRRVEAERLAVVGRLAGQVAHELSNPLAAVKANLRWLETAPPGGEAGDVIADTDEGVRRIARIVDDMRALASDAPEPVPVDAGGILAHARKLVHERTPEAGISVESHGPAMPPASGSPERLARALAHLVAHVLAAAGSRERRVSLSARLDGRDLVLGVTGPEAGPGLHLAGSLDWSLAAELAAQGNGSLEPLAGDALGFALRVPVASSPNVTPAPTPSMSVVK